MLHMDIVRVIGACRQKSLVAIHPRFEFWIPRTIRFTSVCLFWRPDQVVICNISCHPKNKNSLPSLRNAIVSSVQNNRIVDLVTGLRAIAIKTVDKFLVPVPEHARNIFHQENFRSQSFHKLEVIFDKFVSFIIDASIFDPVRRKALAWRATKNHVAGIVSTKEFLRQLGCR